MGIRVKGQSIVAFERTIAELKGNDAMGALLGHLPPDVARAMRNREVLSVGWYPLEWFAALHTAAQSVFGATISREIGRAATRHDVTTLYRFILRFMSPETLVNQMNRIFGMICDSGEVVIDENREGTARVRFLGCIGSNRGTWEDMLGSTETLLELCGGRDPSARITGGGGDGDSTMSCTLTWRKG